MAHLLCVISSQRKLDERVMSNSKKKSSSDCLRHTSQTLKHIAVPWQKKLAQFTSEWKCCQNFYSFNEGLCLCGDGKWGKFRQNSEYTTKLRPGITAIRKNRIQIWIWSVKGTWNCEQINCLLLDSCYNENGILYIFSK